MRGTTPKETFNPLYFNVGGKIYAKKVLCQPLRNDHHQQRTEELGRIALDTL